MSEGGEISVLATILTASLLVMGGGITLIGSLGLLRMESFFERAHAPTLGTTLGTGCIALASIVYFSALGSRIVLPEVLIIAFVSLTTPISLLVLVHAAVLRDDQKTKRSTQTEPS